MNFESFAKAYQQEANNYNYKLTLEQAKQMSKPIYEASQNDDASISMYSNTLKQYNTLLKDCETNIRKFSNYMTDTIGKLKNKLIEQTQGDDILTEMAEQVHHHETAKERITEKKTKATKQLQGAQMNLIKSVFDTNPIVPTSSTSSSRNIKPLLIDYVYSVAQSQMNRDYMEDYIKVVDDNLLLVPNQIHSDRFLLAMVCDGHGGDECAKWTSNNFPIRLVAVAQKNPGKDVEAILKMTLANLVDDWDNHKTVESDISGSTVALTVLDRVDGKLYILNLGDSRVVLFNDVTKEAEFQTKDHELEDPAEEKRVGTLFLTAYPKTRCKVTHHENDIPRVQGIIGMSRAMGDNTLNIKGCLSRTPDTHVIQLKSPYKYSILIGSDGLFDDLNVEHIKLILYNNLKDASTFCTIIKTMHNHDKSMGQDNTSIVVIRTQQMSAN